MVWDLHTETHVHAWPFECSVALEIVTLLAGQIPDSTWAVERLEGFGRDPAYVPRWDDETDSVVDAIDALLSEPAIKLLLRHERIRGEELLERARALVGHLCEPTHPTDGLLEITAAGVSRATGLARVCAEAGIAAEEVIAFGDMPNDRLMLEWAGHGVAVGNAHLEVRAAADEITASNDDAGVARVLERFF